mmetsp:Transcript_12127/g.31939  ORF Transcript_12127/g.31939 Transcript_12127/m.31939 type:complete len:118 (-) Transcript_12127:1462-1815(-)
MDVLDVILHIFKVNHFQSHMGTRLLVDPQEDIAIAASAYAFSNLVGPKAVVHQGEGCSGDPFTLASLTCSSVVFVLNSKSTHYIKKKFIALRHVAVFFPILVAPTCTSTNMQQVPTC